MFIIIYTTVTVHNIMVKDVSYVIQPTTSINSTQNGIQDVIVTFRKVNNHGYK